MPLPTLIVPSQPPMCVARLDTRNDTDLVRKRSARLAAKSGFWAIKPDAQARKVLMKTLGEDVSTEKPDEAAFEEYYVAFYLPLDPTRRKGMCELFLGHRGRHRVTSKVVA